MTIQQKIIKNKAGLLSLAEELQNVSKACKIMGFSRDTFYRYKELVDEGGMENLVDKTRKKPNLKNRIDEEVEKTVVQMAIDFPAYGQTRASNELRKKGIFVSGAGVRCAWLRHNLETFKKRLAAVEKEAAEKGLVLTEAQVQALEKKKIEDQAHGEIETAHPGYLGSQDTFYVGTLKGVGRIYQQTFVDTYAKVAFCKLYNTKTPITSAVYVSADESIGALKILREKEETRLASARATKIELENGVLNKTLVPMAEAQKMFGDLVGSFRTKMLAIPSKAAFVVANMKDPGHVETHLKELICEALDALSLLATEATSESNEESTESHHQ